ncbi:MAG: pentapeptide repeat-containing protein [Kovacikia sp.]
MKLGNFITGVLLTALAATAILNACDAKPPAPSSNGTLQSNSSASISAKPSDNRKVEPPSNSSPDDKGRSDRGRSDNVPSPSPQQSAIDQLLETGQCPGCDLKEANLEGLNLAGVNLEGANLEGANLAFARLESAILKKANLKRANLEGASLGCDIHLNLPRNQSKNGFSIHTHSTGTGNSNVNVNISVSKRAATVDLYADGKIKECVVLQGSNLQEARLPDGSIYR